MSEIALVLADIDGTMLRGGTHEATPEVVQAVRDIEESGVALTVATGRPFSMMGRVLGRLGLKDLGVFDCGASIHDIESGDIVWKKWLDRDVVRELAGILMPHCTEMLVKPDINTMCSAADVRLHDVVDEAPSVFGFVHNSSLDHVRSRIAELPGVTATLGPFSGVHEGLTDIQITHMEAGKYNGVNALRQIVHSDRAHTLAIGDSHNDIPLFQNAGIKVAMGNAVPELKALADYVVAPVEQDGFAEAMQRFVLR